MVEVRSAIDTNHDEAYVRNIWLVPHGTPSTSSDVERFGMTLEGIVPTASRFRQIDSIALAVMPRDRCAEPIFRARHQHSAFGAALCAAHSSPSRTPRTTNRRSTWAVVSWPNEDADNAGELDELQRTRVAVRRAR